MSDEIKPTPEHLQDPYVLQLIEELSMKDDVIESLTAVADVAREIHENIYIFSRNLDARLTAALEELEDSDD